MFETDWDVGGALTLALDRPVSGDTVSPRMSIGRNGLHTSIYKEPRIHRYGPHLYIYDPVHHLLVPMVDEAAARDYFGQRQETNCPQGYVGGGVEV